MANEFVIKHGFNCFGDSTIQTNDNTSATNALKITNNDSPAIDLLTVKNDGTSVFCSAPNGLRGKIEFGTLNNDGYIQIQSSSVPAGIISVPQYSSSYNLTAINFRLTDGATVKEGVHLFPYMEDFAGLDNRSGLKVQVGNSGNMSRGVDFALMGALPTTNNDLKVWRFFTWDGVGDPDDAHPLSGATVERFAICNAPTGGGTPYRYGAIHMINSIVGIGTANPSTAVTLHVSGVTRIDGDITIDGHLAATTKSFEIDHPTKKGKKLIHGVLEGPEHGIYVRGELKDDNVITLPEYWKELVDEVTITVQLTSIGRACIHYVDEITDNEVYVDCDDGLPHCYYLIQGERKDVDKLQTEK